MLTCLLGGGLGSTQPALWLLVPLSSRGKNKVIILSWLTASGLPATERSPQKGASRVNGLRTKQMIVALRCSLRSTNRVNGLRAFGASRHSWTRISRCPLCGLERISCPITTPRITTPTREPPP